MTRDDSYIANLKKDKKQTDEYYLKSLFKKTEQQKYLEEVLTDYYPNRVADIACGAGGGRFI
jgi:hypothetical protein